MIKKKYLSNKNKNNSHELSGIAKAFKLFSWLLSIFVQSFPGLAYFLGYAPPLIPKTAGIFVTILGLVIFLSSYLRKKLHRNILNQIIKLLFIFFIIIVLYGIMLKYFSVVPPLGREGNRCQIGFNMWLLTDKAKNKIIDLAKSDPPIEIHNPNDIMNIYGIWGGKGEPEEIWPMWSINTTGLLMVIVFMLAFSLWSYIIGALLRFLMDPLIKFQTGYAKT